MSVFIEDPDGKTFFKPPDFHADISFLSTISDPSTLTTAGDSFPGVAMPPSCIMDGLDRPTSLEFIGDTAYVVTLTREIWKIDGVSR